MKGNVENHKNQQLSFISKELKKREKSILNLKFALKQLPAKFKLQKTD